MNPKLLPITLNQSINFIKGEFGTIFRFSVIVDELRDMDFSLSKGLFIDDELIGIYIIKIKNEPTGKIKGIGIQGLSFNVNKKYRGQGYGKFLRDYTESLSFDYIWGYHAKSLNNIDYWLKRRTLLAENELVYVTYRNL